MGGTRPGGDSSHAVHTSDEQYEPVFVGDAGRELEELLTRYPTKMAALLPALWIVQGARGWVSEEAMTEVAERLSLTPAYVKGVVTFYTMYHQHPVGKYFIQVCTTSPDGRFTVVEAECPGACGFATPIMINEEFVESVNKDNVPDILSRLP